ncbi:MAG: hypothetical protein OWR62_10845 [Sulfobacillus thermotolerans]|nr:hypothetical protein [Sulfobacillus thermotolerans]
MKHTSDLWPRALLAGVISTTVFTALLTLAPVAGSPTLNVALWDGTLITLNLRLAAVLGYILEILGATLVAYEYQKWLSPRLKGSTWSKGMALGGALWIFWMIIGLPLFDLVSPLVNNGLMLAPGIFASNFGATSSLFFLLSLLAFGLAISWLADTPVGYRSYR